MIISAWWLQTSSKFNGISVLLRNQRSKWKIRKWTTPKRVRIRPKYSAIVASRDRRIKMEQTNKQSQLTPV